MAKRHLFADESGNFDFTTKGSRYFILATVAMDCAAGHELLNLRRDMAWRGVGLDVELHASESPQHIRDEVFALLATLDLRVDCTILEKRKAYPGIRNTEERFYQTAWYRHMKFVATGILNPIDELMVVSASVGTKRKKAAFHAAVKNAVAQVTAQPHRVACWDAATDPCLQIADYCAWAVQRKWERGDARSYDLIKSKLASEFDLFAIGTRIYY